MMLVASRPDGALFGQPANQRFENRPQPCSSQNHHAALDGKRKCPTSTLLPNGTVLIEGGYFLWPSATSSAEVYRPASLMPGPSLFSISQDGKGQGAIWHASTGHLASVNAPAIAGEMLSLYTTTLIARKSRLEAAWPRVSFSGMLPDIQASTR
jgi:hypothetical protein